MFSNHKSSVSRSLALKLLATVAIAAVFIAGCSSDDDSADTTTTTAPAPESTTTTTEPPTTTSPPTTTAPPSTTTTTTLPPAAASSSSAIANGVHHSCTLKDGKVFCWGSNLHGQLGNGESGATAHSSTPVEASGIDDAVAVAAGWEHTCAVHATGEISCWGDDSRGELGNGETVISVALPAKVAGIDNAVDVSAGHWHTCALHDTREISCWGSNHDGQLGNGQTGIDSATPVLVTGISDAISLGVNGEHSCAVHATGEVSCWGDNWRGELGVPTTPDGSEGSTQFSSDVPVKVPGVSGAVEVSSGFDHICALLESGRVSCWGDNEYGQAGHGDACLFVEAIDGCLYEGRESPDEDHQFTLGTYIASPDEVDALDNIVSVATGNNYSCAVRNTGQLACWGDNSSGQLGFELVPYVTSTPIPVEAIDDAIGITAGNSHTCVLREGGAVSCFGSNIYGELGDGQEDLFMSRQVSVAGIDDATLVSASSTHTCALHESGEVSCWGSQWKGLRTDEEGGGAQPVPVKIPAIPNARDLAAGNLVSCAIQEDDRMPCWGWFVGNELTETEDGQTAPIPAYLLDTTIASLGIQRVINIAAEGSHVCALDEGGTITCFGTNLYGQLGNGEFSDAYGFDFAMNVAEITDAIDISLGLDHTCALHKSGEISCWGRNHFGQLGTGEEHVGKHSAVPQKVLGITDAVAVETGAFTTTCALHKSGEVSCWGQSDLGELGTNADPSSDHSAVPVKIAGISDAVAVAAGLYHVCALHTSGEVSCWGAGYLGQLGTDERVADSYSAVPLKVAGISDATDISAGFHHTCALLTGDKITCWGLNIWGQLGDGSFVPDHLSSSPVDVLL